jgi:hypothetical protein
MVFILKKSFLSPSSKVFDSVPASFAFKGGRRGHFQLGKAFKGKAELQGCHRHPAQEPFIVSENFGRDHFRGSMNGKF